MVITILFIVLFVTMFTVIEIHVENTRAAKKELPEFEVVRTVFIENRQVKIVNDNLAGVQYIIDGNNWVLRTGKSGLVYKGK